MTDAGPRFLPGQPPIGYGMTPGVHHNVMTGRDDMTGDPEPAPDADPVVPDKIDLDAPEGGAPAAPTPQPIGWRIKHPDGSVLAEFHNVNTQDYQKEQVKRIGDALLSQAVTPEDKEAAQRAAVYGSALVGVVPVGEIGKRMAMRYDTDQRNSISRDIQEQKNKRFSMRGGGGPAGMVPGGPTKGAHKLDQDLFNRVDSVVKDAQGSEGYKALAALEQSLTQMNAAMSSGNAMSERIAVQQQLRDLTGKASRESEQAAITGAAGMWDSMRNKLDLWVSDNPTLSENYKKQFRSMIATQRQYVQQAKDKLGREVAARIREESSGYPEEDQLQAADVAYGAFTGVHAKPYSPPHERSAAPAATVAGAKPTPAKANVPDLDF